MTSTGPEEEVRDDPEPLLGRRSRERVDLALPWDPELLTLARLMVSTVASRLDFTVDEIEDVRLAIDELCLACAEGAGPDSRLSLCIEHEDDLLTVHCTVDHVADVVGAVNDLLGGMTPAELSRRILDELVDAYVVNPPLSGSRSGHLEKRRTATGA